MNENERRKSTIITDDNFDEESEKLLKEVREKEKDCSFNSDTSFITDIDGYIYEGDFWLKQKVGKGSTVIGENGITITGLMAYQYKNGFISILFYIY